MMIQELVPNFCRMMRIEEDLSPITVNAMKMTINVFLKRTGCVHLNEMTLGTLQSFFYEGREKYEWSYSSFANYHKYLKRFLSWCIAQGYLKENPILQIKRLRKPQSLPRRLTEDEAKRILYASFSLDWRYEFERIRNHAMVATMLYAGIRARELLNLEVMDLNLSSCNLLIRSGKGDKDRNVPLHYKYKLISILKRYMIERQRIGKRSMVLFPSIGSDKRLNYKNLSTICRRISMEAGVKFTPHQLRHTFASVAVEKGVDIVTIKEIMGHTDIGTTMIYLRMSSTGLRENLNRVSMF